jgi:predicted regulator of Ras-like GTPase activity (Roadblock/LC7/MglB family)
MLRAMDARQALADLTEISSQLQAVAIVDADGSVLGSTFAVAAEAQRFAEGAQRLVAEADAVREARDLPALTQLEAATLRGSVFVVCEGERMVAATTRPDPTVGLVFYDLKHCLRSLDGPAAEPEAPAAAKPKAKPKPRAPKKKADASA